MIEVQADIQLARIKRGVDEILPLDVLKEKLKQKKTLRV